MNRGGEDRAASVRVYHDVDQIIAHNTLTNLAFNRDRWDTDGFHDNAVNNSRLTIDEAGKYVIMAAVRWGNNGTGERLVRILLNGVTQIVDSIINPSATITTLNLVQTIYDLVSGDYLEVQVRQKSTIALNVAFVAETSPEFSHVRVGP